jgi:diguanylate cyclase (GGDEF)-like protein
MENLFTSQKNIIFITDRLKEYVSQLVIKDQQVVCILTTLNKLLNTPIEKTIDLSRVGKTDILVVLAKELATSEKISQLDALFKEHYKNEAPYYLLMLKKPVSHNELAKILALNHFYYPLYSSIDHHEMFYHYLIFVFRYILAKIRLDDYISNSFQTLIDSEIINLQKDEIENLYKELDKLSRIDVLTRVLNRRAFFEALETEEKRTLRDIWRLDKANLASLKDENANIQLLDTYRQLVHDKLTTSTPAGKFLDHFGHISCAMLDIDDFKLVNDTYGHMMGDKVLSVLGEQLNNPAIFRENDIVGRYGGEEFIIVLPETSAKDALIPLERLREHFKKNQFKEGEKSFNVTFSVGVSEYQITDKTSEEMINRADKALYHAKNTGKDKIVIYEETLKE